MNQHFVDRLTRSWCGATSRRGVLRGLAGAGVGFGALNLSGAAAKKKKKGKKRKPRQKCQSGTKVDAVGVPGTGASVTTRVLDQGRRYRLRASGFWSSNATNGQDAFADFPFADPDSPVTEFEGVRLGLSVDDGSPDEWGSYTTDHVYEQQVTGQGAALSLHCNDVVHADNSGLVLVEVFCA